MSIIINDGSNQTVFYGGFGIVGISRYIGYKECTTKEISESWKMIEFFKHSLRNSYR